MVRPLRLARIALAAEGLRQRLQFRRAILRATICAIAVALMIGALAFAHLAAWYWLRDSLPRPLVALIFAGFDLVLALPLLLLALRSGPGLAEREARAVRERALDDATDWLAVSALLSRLIEFVMPARK